MQKIPNEDELVKKALQIGAVYAKKRAYGEIESHDSMKLKVEFVYKVLIEDKLIQPLAKDQISDPNMRHKLALWISRQLPPDHLLVLSQTQAMWLVQHHGKPEGLPLTTATGSPHRRAVSPQLPHSLFRKSELCAAPKLPWQQT